MEPIDIVKNARIFRFRKASDNRRNYSYLDINGMAFVFEGKRIDLQQRRTKGAYRKYASLVIDSRRKVYRKAF